MKQLSIALALALLTAGIHAQSATPPLNLKLPNDMPPSMAPASSSTAAKPATDKSVAANGNAPSNSSNNSTRPKDAPGVYYGDTSGRTYHDDEERVSAARQDCDDATYNDTQVHGSVGMGVVSGNHFGGNYQTGAVSFSKRTGSCDHPTGGISVDIGVGQFHGH
ncbi:MAG TPA: hypothetical protein VIM98_02210 [Dyella sp.]|uniref:hypothetical protein n=1 Tax=Dyella sp. TaxID=1869338 RepID=UPI002F949197